MLHNTAAQALRIILFEPLPEVGDPLASMLRLDGLTGTRHVHQLERAQELLANQEADVLIADLDTDRDAVLSFMRDIRLTRHGYDPFIGIIGAESTTTLGQLKEYRAAGLDHLIDKPFSPQVLIDHLLELGRKPRLFVASKTYIGPERRGNRRPTRGETIIQAPNRLAGLIQSTPINEAHYSQCIEEWHQALEDLGIFNFDLDID